MRDLPKRLLATIRRRELLRPGDRVAVAVSGGADSVALLFLLDELRAELGVVLSVAHVNHKLRGAESDGDEAFTTGLAARLGLEFDVAIAPIEYGASRVENTGGKPNLEASARKRRYEFFCELGERGRANKVATAHTLDDQAETVLLRLFRGTGIRGLAGIHLRLRANGGTSALARADENLGGKNFVTEVVRPLLTFRRADLREYLRARGESWREDSSNADVTFLRNRVRQRLLPLISEEFGDAALEHIAELAEIARGEEEFWSARAHHCAESDESDAPTADCAVSSPEVLDVRRLLASPLAVQRRQVCAWLEANAPEASLSFSLVEEILELARGPAGKKLELPGRGDARNVRRGRSELTLECAAGGGVGDADRGDYEYLLPVPGAVAVPELDARVEARILNTDNHLDSGGGPVSEEDTKGLLDPAGIGESLTIRNWRAGDRYWPAHTAKEKKVKDLLADVHATGRRKKLWPVAVNKAGNLVWMRGFAAPEALHPRAQRAIWIVEIGSNC
jgi:tRNA(Ile)-lysidine synthase